MSGAATRLTPSETAGLEDHVEAVTLALQTMAVLLVRERDALTSRAAPELLERIAGDKQAAVEQVTGLYTLLRATLERIGGDGATMSDSVHRLERAQPRLAARVEQLVALTRDCQRANQDNGMLVSAGLRNARGSLATLRTMSAGPGDTSTYGRSGEASRTGAGERLMVRA